MKAGNVRNRVTSGLTALLASVLVGQSHAVDAELERLKQAASEARATLVVRQSVLQKAGREADQTEFLIDTGTRKYRMRYKTFRGAEAKHNQKDLNDWQAGYGMTQPYVFWYHNGFINPHMNAPGFGFWPASLEGKVRVLATAGSRIAYDIVFSGDDAGLAIRTVALAGCDELFVSVLGAVGDRENVSLTTNFHAVPIGWGKPHEQWLHADGVDVKNEGGKKWTDLDLAKAPWILMTDHAKNPEGMAPGQLGLVYSPVGLKEARVLRKYVYSMLPCFVSSAPNLEQRFRVYTFGPMTWQAARARLAEADGEAALFKEAFDGLPPAFGEEQGHVAAP